MKEYKKYLFLNLTLFKESAMQKLHGDLDKELSENKGT